MTGDRGPVIVGASIAGAVTALRLARCGVASTVIEARRAPQAKVCGEGLHPPGRAVLEGVLGDLADLGCPLRGFRLADRRGALLSLDHPGGATGLGCDRLALEQRLWTALAAESAIAFHPGVAATELRRDAGGWVVGTRHGEILAGHVVAADGVRSRLRGAAGRERGSSGGRWGARQRFRTAGVPPSHVEITFLDDCEVFVTALGAGRISVAVLGEEAQVRALRAPAAFAACLARVHGIDRPGARLVPEAVPAILPHRGRLAAPACGDRLYLAGDAAVFLDPISGSGMTLAALTGDLVARAIAAVKSGRECDAAAERRAVAAVERAARPFRRLTAILRVLARRPRLRTAAVAVLRRTPWIVAGLAEPTARVAGE